MVDGISGGEDVRNFGLHVILMSKIHDHGMFPVIGGLPQKEIDMVAFCHIFLEIADAMGGEFDLAVRITYHAPVRIEKVIVRIQSHIEG